MLPLYSNIEEVREEAAKCIACARAESRRQVVFGNGNPDASLMLIGEAPSLTDDSTGDPFTGPAGELLDEILQIYGLSRKQIWITNLVRCYAGRNRDDRVENRPVRSVEVQACRTWLDLEIHYVNPKVLLAVGAPAARQLIDPSFQLAKDRGKLHHHRPDGKVTLATIQPAYVMRLQNLAGADAFELAQNQLVEDIGAAATCAGLL